MESPMEVDAETSFSEQVNSATTVERNRQVTIIGLQDNLSGSGCEKVFHDKKSSKPDMNAGDDSISKTPSTSDCEYHSAATSPSNLNFEMPDNVVKDHCKNSVKNQQLPSPKDVSYTEKISVEAVEAMENETLEEHADRHSNDPNKIIFFVNQDGKKTPSPILQYVLDMDQPFDTVISCEDGRIGAHRLVLASASPYIGDMFCSHDHRLGEVAVLVLPDVRVSVMKVLLSFCYTGTMFFPKEDLQDVTDTMKCLLLGEFGELSMKEVTIQVPPPLATSSEAEGSANRPLELDQEPQPGPSTDINHVPEMSSITQNVTSNETENLITSSSEDENTDNDSSSSESEGDDNGSVPTAAEQERLAFANNFLRHKKENASSEINYLIGPKAPGCKVKKLQCYHCPGAFKSVETLTTHLDDNHGIVLQSRNLTKSEFDKLTYCSHCSTKHTLIASANQCISKHSRSRCFICFEIIHIKKFAEHIKTTHAIEQRNGMCIVKCRWCEAGILLQDPIDNKSMAGHCYSSHFPGGRNGKPNKEDFADEDKNPTIPEMEMKVLPCPTTEKKLFVTDSINLLLCTPSAGSKTKTLNSKPATSSTTPKGSSFKSGKVPAVLALLQKASQKRKLMQEAESEAGLQNDNHKLFENPKKRPRLDVNGKRMQMARRTGIPVGRQVQLDTLINGVPCVPSQKGKGRSKAKSALIDVTKLPKVYVNFKYSKTFIVDGLSSSKEIVSREERENVDPAESNSSMESDALTEEIDMHFARRRHSDSSRCSMPCP